jgi:putative spermidine/putrescine transport system permease protein
MKPTAGRAAGYGPGRVARWVVGILVVAFFVLPLLATVEFTFRDISGGHSLAHYAAIVDPKKAAIGQIIVTGVKNSLMLAVVTVGIVLVLLTPTMILVNLWFPKLRRIFEFVALLPITIPAIVLVVGLVPIYLVVGRTLGTSAWTLSFVYGILVMPFAFRSIQAAIDATNMTTLAEAARSLGASWPRAIWHAIIPNLRSGLLAASFISVAVVLGEYTIASLLNRNNLQTSLVLINRQDTFIGVIFALLALVFAFVLLLIVGRVGRRKERS